MKTKLTLALMAIITSSAFAGIPKILPEFKNAQQLAEWRDEMAAKHATTTTATEDHAFYTGKPYIESTGSYAFKYRSYNPELARWTSEDPSGFPDGANNVAYCAIPTHELDLWGLATVTVTGTPTANVAGSPLGIKVLQAAKKIGNIQAESKVQWTIDGAVNGWIIQHVKFEGNVYNKSDNSLVESLSLEYWEGWQVVGGNIYIGFKNANGTNIHGSDTFRTKSYSTSTYGDFFINGYVGFYADYDLQILPWGYSIPQAINLPSISSAPTGWSTSGGHDHTLRMVWE